MARRKVFLRSCLFPFLLFVCVNVFPQTPGEDASKTEAQASQLSKEWSGDSYRRSIALYVKAADQWADLTEFEKTSACLREASRLFLILAEYEKAKDLLKRAATIADKSNLTDEKIRVYSLHSIVSLRAGQVKKSEIFYKQAIRLSDLTSNPIPIAEAYYSAGKHSYSYGNAEETLHLLQKALSAAERAGEKDLTAEIRLYLGFTFVRQGDPVSSLQEMNSALSIWQENSDARGEAIASFGVGFAFSVLGEKQEALYFYEKAIKAFPNDLDWVEKAKACNGIATIYEEYGDLDLAENYRLEAYAMYQKAGYLYGELATLPSLAELSYLKGNRLLASELYSQGLSLTKRLENDFFLAIIKEGVGNMELDSGEYDNAITNYREALRTYEKLKIKLPRVQGLLGKAFEKKGDLNLAREYYESSLRTNREIKDKFAEAQALYDLARLDAGEDRDGSALRLVSESVAISESFSSNVLNSGLKSTYFSSIYGRYELYIELLMKTGKALGDKNYEILALQASEKARARSMLETMHLSGSNYTKDANPDVVKREKEIRALLNHKADLLTDVLSRDGDDESKVESLSNDMNRLQNELEEIKASLKRDSPIYSAIKNPAPFDVSEFQSDILDDSTVVLAYSLGRNASFLWLIDKDEVVSYALPPREQIESRVRAVRELLASPEIKPGEAVEDYQARLTVTEDAYWSEAQLLSNDLFGQIGSKLTRKRLIIVPDGKLHYFPIAALPHPNSDDREPILLTNETIYEPSASAVSLLMMQEKYTSEPQKDLLVFSDPIFSTQDSRLPPETASGTNIDAGPTTPENVRFVESLKSLPRLVASRDEGHSIAEIVGPSRSTVFTGFAATREQALSQEISDHKIIHFATHSLTNEERPELSGIVLSRFDENGQPQNEFVRLQDIYGLNLSTDLVVLSACNTGIGKEVKGEGLLNLTNAFMQVGAKSVVSTLWKVEDNATLELMKNFYGALAKENATPSEALRDAQIKMSKSQVYNSPIYWAAFTVQGDYRRTPNLSSGSSSHVFLLIIVFGALFLAACGIYRFRKARRS